MGSTHNGLLPLLAGSTDTSRLRAPREMFARLQFLAALLHEAPPDEPLGGRLLWRDEQRQVRVRPLDRLITIGRAPDCDVILESSRASRRHCEVVPEGETGLVRDLESMNGTRVNGVELGKLARPLHDGDIIEAGGVWIAYAIGAAERRLAG